MLACGRIRLQFPLKKLYECGDIVFKIQQNISMSAEYLQTGNTQSLTCYFTNRTGVFSGTYGRALRAVTLQLAKLSVVRLEALRIDDR